MKWRVLSSLLRAVVLPLPVAILTLPLTATEVSAQSQATTGVLRGTTLDAHRQPSLGRRHDQEYRDEFHAHDQIVGRRRVRRHSPAARQLSGYGPRARAQPGAQVDIRVNLGQTVEVPLVLERSATTLGGVTVLGADLVDQTKTAEATQLPARW